MEDFDNDPEEIPEEELVTKSDRASDVTESESSAVMLGVGEVMGRCAGDNDTNHV